MECFMVKITIIGWYGTETIGDRAILAGLFSILKESAEDFEIQLGCLYPFFTERTLLEDEEFFKLCSGADTLRISLFDSSHPQALKQAIRNCDWLVVGGGPLEDIPCLFMLEYALIKARKLKKRTLLLGCGIGPLYKKIYQKSVLQIIRHADVCIFRDHKSRLVYEELSGTSGTTQAAIDPAVFALELFKQHYFPLEKQNIQVVSVRQFPAEYKIHSSINGDRIDQKIIGIIHWLAQEKDMPILLLPMHYWGIGDDDRQFMNRIRFATPHPSLQVQNAPLNTVDTMKQFASAATCIGMRYHAVVFQTLLNGKNMILDYTDPQTGKIGNFLEQIQASSFYQTSYLNLQASSPTETTFPLIPFTLDSSIIQNFRRQYLHQLQNLNL